MKTLIKKNLIYNQNKDKNNRRNDQKYISENISNKNALTEYL